mmetsp:Transcript_48779/g.123124  ORF Transcript_48779/g.123124 Transcript_48779/m.123124 type:complete len:190 (+) Transcript_48779:75-644(+)
MGNCSGLASLVPEEVPVVLGLTKTTSVLYQRGGHWIPGTVARAWSNKTVSLDAIGGVGGWTAKMLARDVFPIEVMERGYIELRPDGTPGYSKLSDPGGELPVLPAAWGAGVLIRGLPVVLIIPEGEFVGVVRSLRSDGQVQIDFDEGGSRHCPSDRVYPLKAYSQPESSSNADLRLMGAMAVDAFMAAL